MATEPRPVFRNIHVTQLAGYRLPLAGIVSILHRVSGVLMFLLLPFVIWLFDVSLTSEVSFERFSAAYNSVLVKLVTLALIWAYLHHLFCGLRYVWMDVTHSVSKEQGHLSAVAVAALTGVLTLALAAKLFGLY